MNIIQKVNSTRYTLKEILEEEWDVSSISDLSNQEIEKIYNIPSSKNSTLSSFGIAAACNFSLQHKFIPSHRLHIIYYNFPEIGRNSSKVTKSSCDKILNLYKSDLINFEDSLIIIINDTISESLEKSFLGLNVTLQGEFEGRELNEEIIQEMKENDYYLEKKHFRNVHILSIDNITNNILKHRLVPTHQVIRRRNEIEKILKDCNCKSNQLPIILKDDIISKLKRVAPGDICKIIRKNEICGENIFYRICK
tara:strand:+ start:37 stop:792 length:756 start_codon:yes stop_codon:yes gene_type:complete